MRKDKRVEKEVKVGKDEKIGITKRRLGSMGSMGSKLEKDGNKEKVGKEEVIYTV